MAPIRLRHIHLPASPSEGLFPSYRTAAAVQELLRRRLLDFKDAEASSAHPRAPPHPTLISFTPQPTYTLGRRQSSQTNSAVSSLSPAEIARLRAPLHVRSSEPGTLPALGVVPGRAAAAEETTQAAAGASSSGDDVVVFHPSVMTSPRGGLATYHGPGQVVLWPVMVINSASPLGYRHFTVRCYSRLLERTTIALLRRLFGLEGFTTDDPGVWVRTPPAAASSYSTGPLAATTRGLPAEGGGEVRKISAMGIHLRRHVSSLGTAINLDMPGNSSSSSSSLCTEPAAAAAAAAADERHNPWARFVACGLEGKGVTCVEEELRAAGGAGIPGVDAEVVARAWAEELAKGMGIDPGAVELVARDEVDEVVARAREEGFVDAVAKDEI